MPSFRSVHLVPREFLRGADGVDVASSGISCLVGSHGSVSGYTAIEERLGGAKRGAQCVCHDEVVDLAVTLCSGASGGSRAQYGAADGIRPSRSGEHGG